MTITATAVAQAGATTTVTDSDSVEHVVPPEGLAVLVTAPLTLPDGQTIEPGPTPTVVFPQPVTISDLVVGPALSVDALAAALVEE